MIVCAVWVLGMENDPAYYLIFQWHRGGHVTNEQTKIKMESIFLFSIPSSFPSFPACILTNNLPPFAHAPGSLARSFLKLAYTFSSYAKTFDVRWIIITCNYFLYCMWEWNFHQKEEFHLESGISYNNAWSLSLSLYLPLYCDLSGDCKKIMVVCLSCLLGWVITTTPLPALPACLQKEVFLVFSIIW